MQEIIVQGQRESSREEQLTVREVRETPARDIGEALKQVEGIDIVHKGTIANDVVLRGLQKDNINVFLDGVRLHGACPSRMDSPAFHFDFAEVDQIRIIKGPYDITNPGGIGGVIDAVPKKADLGFDGNLSLTYGSYGMVNAAATASYGAELGDVLGGYAYKYSDVPEAGNGRKITDIYAPTSPNRYTPDGLESEAYDINTGWVRLGLNPTADSHTELSYSHQNAQNILYPYLLMDAKYDRTDTLDWTYRINDLSPLVRTLGVQAYWNQIAHVMDDSLRASSVGKMRDYSMQTDAYTQTYGFKADSALAVGPGKLTVGVDYYSRAWDAVNRMASMMYMDTAMIPDVLTDNLGCYAGYELPLIPDLVLKGGVRNDVTWIQAHKLTNKPIDQSDYDAMSGNAQLIWTPEKHMEYTAGFGSAVRPPDAQELFINSSKQQGNPFLNPTRNNEFDLGVKYADNGSFVKFAVFDSNLENFINLVPDGTRRTFRNIDANIWGAEMSAQTALLDELFLRGGLSYTEGRNLTDDQPLSEMPPCRGTVALRYDVNVWFIELAQHFAAAQDRVDTDLRESETAPWTTTDMKAGYHCGAFSLYAGIYNMFDRFYYTSLSYQRDPFASGVKVPENGRTVAITATYTF